MRENVESKEASEADKMKHEDPSTREMSVKGIIEPRPYITQQDMVCQVFRGVFSAVTKTTNLCS